MVELLRLAEPRVKAWHDADFANWRMFSGKPLLTDVKDNDPRLDQDSKDLLAYILEEKSRKIVQNQFESES